MTVLQLSAFDIVTASPWQMMSTTGFWATLPRLARRLPTAKLWMVADTLNLDQVRTGFEQVAVPKRELPLGVRGFRDRYDEFLEQVVEEVRHIRLYLVMESRLDDQALCDVLASYGVPAQTLDHEVPLPFITAQDRWSHVTTDDGQRWGILQSKPVQFGMIYARTLHRLYQLDFPVWACLNVYSYTDQEAKKLLRLKSVTARYSERKTSEQAQEADEMDSTVGRLRAEMNRVGGLLHTVRLYVAVGGKDDKEYKDRMEIVRSAVPLDMTAASPAGETLRKVFSVQSFPESEAAPVTSPGVALLVGSAMSYRRRTETGGVLLGIDRNQAPVILNIFDPRSSAFNMLVLGQTGSGKTFAILLLMLRHLLLGTRLIIVDPQGNVDLSFLGADIHQRSRLGTESASINILDITQSQIGPQVESVCSMLSLLGVMPRLDPLARAVMDDVLLDIYRPIWGREIPAPTLYAVQTRLEMLAKNPGALPAARQAALTLAYSMTPYTIGSYAALFNQPTTVDTTLAHPVTVYDVSNLPGQELNGNMRAALLAILVADVNQGIRRLRATGNTAPILFFVDEMGMLMRDPVIASYVSKEYMTARARRVGMIVADQELESLLGPRDERGMHNGAPILANSPFTLIFYQKDSERQRIRENFSGLPLALSEAVFRFPRGVCLAQLQSDVMVVNVRPSAFERTVLTSQLADKEKRLRVLKSMADEMEMSNGT